VREEESERQKKKKEKRQSETFERGGKQIKRGGVGEREANR